MGTFEPSQKKPSHTASSPIATSLFRSRSSPKPSATVEEASTDTPDFQARWDFARSHAPNLNSLAANSSGDRSPSTIQPKLTVGAPNDQYEQEADRVADQVMSMPAPTQPVQRDAIKDVQTKPLLQRGTDGSLQAESDFESRLNRNESEGRLLSNEVRTFMEPRIGADFSQVRVHTGNEAIQISRDLNAQAFTHKQDVYFGAGKTPGNNALTAHELTHVVQQTGRVQARTEQRVPTIKDGSGVSVQRVHYSETEESEEVPVNSSGGQTPIDANMSMPDGTEVKSDVRTQETDTSAVTTGNQQSDTGAGGAGGAGGGANEVEREVYEGNADGHSSSEQTSTVPLRDDSGLEPVHDALDIAGLAPEPFGAVADLTNAGIYASEGRYDEAANSGVAAIPGVGMAATTRKMEKKAAEAALREEKALKKVENPKIDPRKGERGRFKKAEDSQEQVDSIEAAQKALRNEGEGEAIRNAKKSAQRGENDRKRIKNQADADEEYKP